MSTLLRRMLKGQFSWDLEAIIVWALGNNISSSMILTHITHDLYKMNKVQFVNTAKQEQEIHFFDHLQFRASVLDITASVVL